MTWFIIFLFPSGILWLVWLSKWRDREQQRLGVLSSQWLAEYRQNQEV